jgi:predicted nuclease of predicted toxin-antitoxin system
MTHYLFDENLSRRVANVLAEVGAYTITAVGDDGAPHLGSTDQAVVAWCASNQHVLVTSDRGRRDRAILTILAASRTHGLFVWNGITLRQQLELIVRHIDKLDRDVSRAETGGRTYRKRLLKPWRFTDAPMRR